MLYVLLDLSQFN